MWNRRTGCYRGEFGPEIKGSNHVMIRAMAFNEHIAVSAHKVGSRGAVVSVTDYIFGNGQKCL